MKITFSTTLLVAGFFLYQGSAFCAEKTGEELPQALVQTVEFDEPQSQAPSAPKTEAVSPAAGPISVAKAAEASKAPAAKVSLSAFQSGGPGKLDLDALISTVNTTLAENRNLKKDMTTVQEGFERITIENNVLKSRVRTMEHRLVQKDDEKKDSLVENRKSQVQIDELRKKNEESYEKYLEERLKLQKSDEEIKKLEAKLGEAILESERAVYVKKIQHFKDQTEEAAKEISRVASAEASLKDELAETSFGLANQLFERRQFDKAAQFYEQALRYNSQLSFAHYNLGVVYDYYLNDNPKAIEHYRAFLQIEPEDGDAAKVKERMLELELLKNLVPSMPLKLDFDNLHQKNN